MCTCGPILSTPSKLLGWRCFYGAVIVIPFNESKVHGHEKSTQHSHSVKPRHIEPLRALHKLGTQFESQRS